MYFPNFEGKAVTFSYLECSEFTIFNPYFEEQAGRVFVVGESLEEGIREGKVNAIAWDQVVSYTVYDSKEEYLLKLEEVMKEFEEFDV